MKERTKVALQEYTGNFLGVLVVWIVAIGAIAIIDWIKAGFR